MKIECPYCQQHYEIEDGVSGRVQCMECQKEFDIEPTESIESIESIESTESTEPTEKSAWGKISDVLDTEIKIFEDEPQKVPDNIIKNEIAATNKDELDVDLFIPQLFYALAVMVIIGTMLAAILVNIKMSDHDLCCPTVLSVIGSGLVTSLIFFGIGRMITSGIIMETYLKDLHKQLTRSKKDSE